MIKSSYAEFSPQSPNPENRYTLTIGIKVARINLSINSYTNEVKSQLYINDKKLFNCLYAQREEVESKFNEELIWESLDKQKSSTISLIKNFNLKNDWTWKESIQWQLDTAITLKKSFSNKIRKCQKE